MDLIAVVRLFRHYVNYFKFTINYFNNCLVTTNANVHRYRLFYFFITNDVFQPMYTNNKYSSCFKKVIYTNHD